MDQPQPRGREEETTPRCHWHPEVETRLSCSRCQKHICTQCVIQAPVGIRCRDCGRAAPMPTYDVRPTYYARAIAAAAAAAVGGGLLWWLLNLTLNSLFGRVPLLHFVGALAVGYAAGNLISLSVNGKRGAGLALIAGGSVAIAFLISSRLTGPSFDLMGLLLLVLGVFIAVQRVR